MESIAFSTLKVEFLTLLYIIIAAAHWTNSNNDVHYILELKPVSNEL
ncbi:hypothetical protein [Acinetobacter sp. ANC 3813]|nr:hypothetical protein [Acinetobacter sp. ANC 3813]